MSFNELLFGVLSLFTHVIEAITGFGSTVLALPFGIAIAGVSAAVPALALHAWLLSAYVVVTDFKKIVWRLYLVAIVFVLAGMPLGMWAFAALPENVLKAVLSIFMVIVAVQGIVRSRGQNDGETPSSGKKKILLYALLVVGGVIHGAFSSGGPLIIVYVTKVIREKRSFRATMCAFWLSLNAILLVRYLVTGVFTAEVTRLSLITVPFLAAGVLIGNWAHRKIPGKLFLLLIYIVLLLSGLFMAYSSFGALLAAA